MGQFGLDANSTSQSLENFQATTQYGNAIGATKGKGAVGAGSAGVTNSRITAGKGGKGGSGGDVNLTVNNENFDSTFATRVLETTAAFANDVLERNQSFNTLAVGYAAQNATQALQALQALGGGQQVVAAGGTASDVIDSQVAQTPVGSTSFAISKPLVAVTVLITLAAIGYYYYSQT